MRRAEHATVLCARYLRAWSSKNPACRVIGMRGKWPVDNGMQDHECNFSACSVLQGIHGQWSRDALSMVRWPTPAANEYDPTPCPTSFLPKVFLWTGKMWVTHGENGVVGGVGDWWRERNSARFFRCDDQQARTAAREAMILALAYSYLVRLRR